MIKFFYGPENQIIDAYRIKPAPQISINTKLDYANDSIIGYSYVININGIASTYEEILDESLGNSGVYDICTGDNLTTEDQQIFIGENETILYNTNPNASVNLSNQNLIGLLGKIEDIKRLFSRNGSSLTIKDDQNNDMLKAKGGTIRSISFEQSNNHWVKTCPYTIELEFNELEIFNETFNCANPYINSNPGLVDTSKYHIKSFTDKWNFDISEDYNNFIYESGRLIPITNDSFAITGGANLWNPSIKVSYNISAVGKNYYDADGPGPNEKVVPAWLQAKNFAQEKLYNQINSFGKILSVFSGCDPNNLPTLQNVYQNNPDNPLIIGSGLIEQITNGSDPYRIYDEIVTCNVSESEGSFSLDYSCIVKRDFSNLNYAAGNVKHTCNKTVNKSTEGLKKVTTISIDGQVEGLVFGGIVSALDVYKNISFNKNGSLFSKYTFANKFNNANAFLSKILNTAQTDLKDNFKTDLGITMAALEISDIASCVDQPSKIKPTKFNLTKDYTNGTISYNAEYSSLNSCINAQESGTIFNTKVTIDEPVPVLVELPVPNGNYIIQDIGTVTARKISISAEGRKINTVCCEEGTTTFLTDCVTKDLGYLFPFLDLPDEELYVLTNKNFTYDPLMSSYTVNLGYICTSGCDI